MIQIDSLKALWFIVRTDKVLKDGKAPIWMLYVLNGKRVKFNTGLKVYPEYWDLKNKTVYYLKQIEAKKALPHLKSHEYLTTIEVEELKSNLASIRQEVKRIEDTFILKEISFSPSMVLDELKRIKFKGVETVIKIEEPTNFVFDFMDNYIREHESSREAGSLTVYKSVKNHLKAFQEHTRQKVTFENIDYGFFSRFQTFLINRVKTDVSGNESPMLNNTTIAKALSTLKTFLSYARKEGIKVNDSYRDFTIKREKLEVITLEQNELDTLLKIDLNNNNRLDKVRDIFVFACATGLRFSDVQQLKREHIDDDSIKIVVKKTKTLLTIPLNELSGSILDKYSDLYKPLPSISNQRMNDYIKELCQMAEINRPMEIVRFHGKKRIVNTYPKYELISFHNARKTFVTLSLERGMSAEEVMTISGHEDYKSFKRYVNVTEKRKKVVMLKAWGDYKPKLKVVN